MIAVSRLILSVGAAVAFLGLQVTPAAAQLGTSRSGSTSSHTFTASEQQSWRALLKFGDCYAKDYSRGALRLIATEPGSRDEATVYRSLFGKDNVSCLGTMSRMTAPIAMIRGVIAEGLYQRNVAMPPEMRLAAPALPEVRNLSGAARCYVGSNVREARTLLATKPGSREEYDAVEMLIPAFEKCVPEGARLDFSPTLIRFRIAEALFRLGATAEKI